MARFHFQVSDTEGKIRRGTMEAQSLSDAREIAGRRGYTVIELREAVDGVPEPVIKVSTKVATSRFQTGPATPREFDPGILERIGALFSVQVVRIAMGTLIVVGLIWMVVGWRSQAVRGGTSGGPKPVNTPTLTALKLQVEGSVEVIGSSSVGDVQITIDLPEIPYQQTYEWSKLKHPRPGHFYVEVEFESTRKARHLIVHARKPGLGETSTEVISIPPDGGKQAGLKLIIKPKG